jgi:hypothetical protein
MAPKTIEQVVRGIKGRKFTLMIQNVAKRIDTYYGASLQLAPRHEDRFFVLSNEHLSRKAQDNVVRTLNQWVITPVVVQNALRIAAQEEVTWHQSFAGGVTRPTHPGGWGDVTRVLAGSYQATVDNDPVNLQSYR